VKTAIYGAGSMGTVLGAYLSRAGVAVDLVSRNKAHIGALRTKGAVINGTASFATPPLDGVSSPGRALVPEEMKDRYDLVILLTKQQENAAVAAMLKDFLAPAGVLCTLQNGLPEFRLAGILGEDRVLGCMVAWGAILNSPGCATLTSDTDSMSFGLGSPGAKPHPMIGRVKEILEKMCPVDVEENFIGVRWSKLIINAAFSGMSAVTGWNFGRVAAERESRNCALHVIRECIDVCRAAGIRIAPVQGRDIVRLLYFSNPLQKLKASVILPLAIKKHRAITSSMFQDLDRGRISEIDDINGVVSAAGIQHGVSTIYNDRIVEIVHAIERGERKYGKENIRLFRDLRP
jgi:2-dehydropantoate 2-reductase